VAALLLARQANLFAGGAAAGQGVVGRQLFLLLAPVLLAEADLLAVLLQVVTGAADGVFQGTDEAPVVVQRDGVHATAQRLLKLVAVFLLVALQRIQLRG